MLNNPGGQMQRPKEHHGMRLSCWNSAAVGVFGMWRLYFLWIHVHLHRSCKDWSQALTRRQWWWWNSALLLSLWRLWRHVLPLPLAWSRAAALLLVVPTLTQTQCSKPSSHHLESPGDLVSLLVSLRLI